MLRKLVVDNNMPSAARTFGVQVGLRGESPGGVLS